LTALIRENPLRFWSIGGSLVVRTRNPRPQAPTVGGPGFLRRVMNYYLENAEALFEAVEAEGTLPGTTNAYDKVLAFALIGVGQLLQEFLEELSNAFSERQAEEVSVQSKAGSSKEVREAFYEK
jgi:hypothetical protein